MATLDETNIFGLTPEQPEKKDDSLSRLGISESGYLNRLAQIQQMNLQGQTDMSEARSARGAEKKVLRDQYFSDLAEAAKDPTQEKRDTALESFFETPFMFQMGQYIPDPTGLPTDIAEAEYSGRKFNESRQARGKTTEFYPGPLGMGDRPFYPDMTPEEAGLLLQQGLAIASIPPGIGGIAGIAQSMIGLPSKVLRSKSMDGQGGGGGGISNIQPQPTKDYAGFVSSVERAALGPQRFGTGQDLIKYLEAGRKGVSTKELEYIDFDQIRNNPDLTKEDVIAHIQANRPKVYRIERSEDNPTYQADSSDNPLNELPFNEEASRIANLEQQAYFRDEYAQEIADHNEILTNNPTLQNSNFVLNSENINDPSVLDDLERYLKTEPEAYSGTNPTIVKYTKPDGTTGTGAYESYASIMDFPDKFDELIKLAKDGATIEFPALTRNADDILEEASAMRVSPDYGNQFEIYEAVGDNTSSIYKITGNDDTGYQVYVDDEPVRGDLGTRGGADIAYFDDLADARARVQAEAFDNGDIREDLGSIDYGSNANRMIDSLPSEVISGQATLRTRFGDEYSDYRLPMGGAENYREFTLHIENPKTATRYDSSKGTKHFGGGDELLHYRVTDRIDEDGKRVLFVEEIQSDLHSTASSTKSDANYEIGSKNIDQINKRIGDIDNDFQLVPSDTMEGKYQRLAINNIDIPIDNPMSMGEALNIMDAIKGKISMNRLGADYQKTAKDLVDKFGKKEIIDILSELEPMRKAGNLPDLPYKGNDYIDLAVKDIMKLAAEGNYDRVAFTNPATQLRRNRKDLEYIDSIEINQVPFLTKAEQQFNEDFVRTSEQSRIPVGFAPDSNVYETIGGTYKMRFDGSLGDADLNSFVSTHTDFVVNNPQAQKFWQDFHKNQKIKSAENYETDVYNYEEGMGSLSENSGMSYEDYMKFGSPDHRLNVDYIFSKADSPLTPAQVAEELQAIGIRKAKKRRLQETQEAIAKMQEATPMTNDEAYDGFLNMTEAFYKATEGSDSAYHKSLAVPPKFFPKKPFDQLTLDDMPVSPRELANINQETRRGISYLMGEFRRNTLPNLDNAGKYIVNTKGTGYKVDRDKFMIERGEIQDNYKGARYDDLDSMIEDLRLDKKTEEIVRKDAEKGLIPVSTTDKQIYQIEAEGGDGKKPKLIYSSLIPKSATKFAKKYNKDAEAKLKNVLYTSDENLSPTGLHMDFLAEQAKLRAKGQNLIKNIKADNYDTNFGIDLKAHEAATIDITPEMRKAILEEGVNVMYKGGIVNKVKSMDKPIQGNRREM
jgi:hypothetical protein